MLFFFSVGPPESSLHGAGQLLVLSISLTSYEYQDSWWHAGSFPTPRWCDYSNLSEFESRLQFSEKILSYKDTGWMPSKITEDEMFLIIEDPSYLSFPPRLFMKQLIHGKGEPIRETEYILLRRPETHKQLVQPSGCIICPNYTSGVDRKLGWGEQKTHTHPSKMWVT